jgi:dephospho-CoA kinase
VTQDHCAPVVGLVGGIGSGKSGLAHWVSQHAPITVLDGDQLGHQALAEPELARKILDRFPSSQDPDNSSTIHSQHQVNRAALAEIVFGDDLESEANRHDLEEIVHPFIRRRLKEQIQQIQQHRGQDGCEGILVDAAVLLEAGWDDLCDHVVFVDVPEDIRLTRVETTRNWTRSDYLDRQASQWPLQRKQDTADTSLDNSTSLEDSGPRLLSLIHSLNSRNSRNSRNGRNGLNGPNTNTSASCP